jgi:hypothetical protein
MGTTSFVILEERADGGLSYVRIDGNSSMMGMVASFPSEHDRFMNRDAAEENVKLLKADNVRRVEATKRRRKFKTLPATYTVIECTQENEARITQRWRDGLKRTT